MPSFKNIIQPGLASVRQNWPAIVVLQGAAVILTIGYFNSPALRQALVGVEDWKRGSGIVGAFAAGSLAGGFTPEFAKLLGGRLQVSAPGWLVKVLFTAFVYGCVGVTVDIFYQYQAVLFGSGVDWLTVAKKVALDMSLFSVFLSIPMACLLFTFFEAQFKWSRFISVLRDKYFEKTYAPSLVMCWAVWIPLLACIYAFPLPLQFPIAQLAEGGWSIIFVFMNTKQHGPAEHITP